MRVSAIITTYDQPDHLEKVLWGYARQRAVEFELVIADDGSGPETAEVIDVIAAQTGLDILHVWHTHDGFRKTEILNRAIVASRGDYLIFSDGDCVPRYDFVATHARLAQPRSFLSGGYIKLPMDVSERISIDDIVSGRAMGATTLRAFGWRPRRRVFRLLDDGALPAFLDAITPTRRTWNGHNSSTWRRAIIDANGFDLDMGYGGLDRALGERLVNAGFSGRQVRYRTPCLHLHHERPYIDSVRWQRNHEMRERIRRDKETRARNGIGELEIDDSVVIRRAGRVPKRRPLVHAAMSR